MNKVTLIGRWTKDLELRFAPTSGTAVATGNLAVDRRYKKDGQAEADFIQVVIWGKIAESASQYTGKGKLCAISGRLQTRSYDGKDGNKRFITEVIAEEVKFLQWITSKADGNTNNPAEIQEFEGDMIEVSDGELPF